MRADGSHAQANIVFAVLLQEPAKGLRKIILFLNGRMICDPELLFRSRDAQIGIPGNFRQMGYDPAAFPDDLSCRFRHRFLKYTEQ